MSRLDEKRFTALGQEWIARFDFNATCAIEEETGESFYAVAAPFLKAIDQGDAKDPDTVLAMLGTRKNSAIRLMLYHALSYEHDIDLLRVGEIIGEIGLGKATELVLWAIARGIDANADGDEGNAPKAPAAPNRKARRAAAARG